MVVIIILLEVAWDARLFWTYSGERIFPRGAMASLAYIEAFVTSLPGTRRKKQFQGSKPKRQVLTTVNELQAMILGSDDAG